MFMLAAMLRTLIIYLLVIGTMRLMGKRQLGELQPSELVSTILISNLASISIESTELPLSASIVPVLLIAVLELFSSALVFCLPRVGRIMSGSPVTVIREGAIDQAALRRLRYTAGDLMEALRGQQIFDPTQVAYAAVETGGTLSALPGPDASSPGELMLPVIEDGLPCPENLRLCGKDAAWLDRQLHRRRLAAGQVLLMLAGAGERVVLIPKEKKGGEGACSG